MPQIVVKTFQGGSYFDDTYVSDANRSQRNYQAQVIQVGVTSGPTDKFKAFFILKLPEKPPGLQDSIGQSLIKYWASGSVGTIPDVIAYIMASFAPENVSWTYRDFSQQIQWDEADAAVTASGDEYVDTMIGSAINTWWEIFVIPNYPFPGIKLEWGGTYIIFLTGVLPTGNSNITFDSANNVTTANRPKIEIDGYIIEPKPDTEFKVEGIVDDPTKMKFLWTMWDDDTEDFGEYALWRDSGTPAEITTITDIGTTELVELLSTVVFAENTLTEFYLTRRGVEHDVPALHNDNSFSNKIPLIRPTITSMSTNPANLEAGELFELTVDVNMNNAPPGQYVDRLEISWGDGTKSIVKNNTPSDLTPTIKAKHMYHKYSYYVPLYSPNIVVRAWTNLDLASDIDNLVTLWGPGKTPTCIPEVSPIAGDKAGTDNPTTFIFDLSKSFSAYIDEPLDGFRIWEGATPPAYQSNPVITLLFGVGEAYGTKTIKCQVRDSSGSANDESTIIQLLLRLESLDPVDLSATISGLDNGTTRVISRTESLERVKEVIRVDGSDVNYVIDKGMSLRKVSLSISVKGPNAPSNIQALYDILENNVYVKVPVLDDDQSEFDGDSWTYNLSGFFTKIQRRKKDRHMSKLSVSFLVVEVT